MGYTADQISVKEIEIEKILELHIVCEVGKHSCLTLTGYLKEGSEERIMMERKAYEKITICLKKKTTIFSGVLTNVTIKKEGKLSKIKLEAKSGSILLDQKKKSRSFQRTSMTYKELAQIIVSQYPNTEVNFHAKEQPIGQIAIQYQETDWEFLKRMCSELYTPITCRVHGEKTQIYIGVPAIHCKAFSYQKKAFRKELGEFDYWKQQGKSVKDSDFFIMTVQTDHIPEIFTSLSYKGAELVIKRYEYVLKNGMLYCYCDLQRKNGVLEKIRYPMDFIGIALNSRIIDVKGTQVKVHFDIDEQGSEDVHWFDFSTLSASKDGSGWYYMPEKGDQVRIYFPSKHTKDAMAISAVNTYEGKQEIGVTSSVAIGSGTSATTQANPDKMSNPSTKYLSNTNGQEMKMSEEGIFLSCAGGSATVQIGNDGTLILQSAKSIDIQAQNNISLEAEEDLILHAAESAVLVCAKGGQIQFLQDGTLKMQGTEVKID